MGFVNTISVKLHCFIRSMAVLPSDTVSRKGAMKDFWNGQLRQRKRLPR
jgi:hypothetical protein